MRTFLTVYGKEVLDYFRDRRTLLTSLLIGPLFGPVLFAFVINISIERAMSDASQPLDLAVIGAEHAPNLVQYLASKNIDAVDGPADLEAAKLAVTDGTHDVVLRITEGFGTDLASGMPARVELVSDQANSDADRDARRGELQHERHQHVRGAECLAGEVGARGELVVEILGDRPPVRIGFVDRPSIGLDCERHRAGHRQTGHEDPHDARGRALWEVPIYLSI